MGADNQTSADGLRQLNAQYRILVEQLNTSIDVATTANNAYVIAKANVAKNKYKLDLIKEQIMSEKKLIDAGRS